MNKFTRALVFFAPLIALSVYFVSGNTEVKASEASSIEDAYDNDIFPRDLKYLFPPPVPVFSDPERTYSAERVAYGAVYEDEELEQPVNYSHKLHAGEMQIECQYCHSYARRSIHAGIPSSQICMNCHGEDTTTGKLKVAIDGREDLLPLLAFHYGREKASELVGDDYSDKIPLTVSTSAGEVEVKQGPVPWVKVHDLPDFVHFSHKRHVKAGVLCQECHGEVQDDMTVGRRVSELTMGWCLTCHESHPSIQENYCGDGATDECAEASLRRTEIKDCWTCHK
jgi:hypothetical protein